MLLRVNATNGQTPTAGNSGFDNVLDVVPWDEDAAIRSAASRELPDELSRLGVSRLSWIALCASGVLAGHFGWGCLFARDAPPRIGALVTAAITASLATFAVTKIPRAKAQAVVDLGFGYLILMSLLLGLVRHSYPWPANEIARQWSMATVPIILFGALIPYRPKNVLLISLSAAATDPLALYMMRGNNGVASIGEAALLATSPFLAAFMAFAASRVVFGLNERVAAAREIGSYHLLKRLGAGRMAEVWQATHKMLARPAAVKVMRAEVLAMHGQAEAHRLVQLFAREARATASLSSPHTVRVYDFGVTREGAFYFVTELLDGLDLKALVERFGAQPGERVAHLLGQACHSLHEAHSRSFVHRDVKPANLFTCRCGQDFDFAKVLDFGLVLDRHPPAEDLEHEERLVGTPAVMAPEMVRFEAPVDARADIYALGCVAYWLLTGKQVFEAETRHDMLIMHAHQKPTPPSKRLGSPVQPELEAVVMACLDKNPNHRPQTAVEVGETLAAIRFEHPWTPERARLWWRTNMPEI
jgi:eukaryotic-like serine/threonine-protein kinase